MKGSWSSISILALACFLSHPEVTRAADVQVNAPDHNAPNQGNNTTQSETNVAVSGSAVVVGYNTSKEAGLLGLANWHSISGLSYSSDGGATFTDGGFVPPPPTSPPALLLGDPALAFNRIGDTLYYASIGQDAASVSKIFVSKAISPFNPPVFAPPVAVSGLVGGFQDKEFIAVDTTGGPYDGRVYVAWTEFSNPGAQVAFATAPPTLVFSPTIGLSPSTGLNQGAMPAAAPNGDVYVVWGTFSSASASAPQTVSIVRSTNGGSSFSAPVTIANITSTVGDMVSGGVNIRTRGFPYIAIDQTPPGSATRGHIYVVFQAKPVSASRSEIFFTRSTDQGMTWSTPRDITSGPAVTLNADPTLNDDWMPSIAVSPTTGHIRVTFYSRREDTANTNIRVYDAGSTDGGQTWFNQPRSTVSFTPSTGYDPLMVSTYMGDYLHVVASGSNYDAAWGDTRNNCAPPGSASAPCSPTGRADQDVFFSTTADPTGPDLAITPWGWVTGNGPLWQSPDIFVVDSANNVVNAKKLIINNLRARVRNLGNAGASGGIVRFKYAPIFVGLAYSMFEQIAAVPVSFSAAGGGNDLQDVPASWDLTNPSFNGSTGQWGANSIGLFDHFCVIVEVDLPSDVNQSNNWAQNNFVDVTDNCCSPVRFLVGNPFDREVRARLVVDPLPKGYRVTLREVTQSKLITLRPKEIRVATLQLSRPKGFERQRRTSDVVASVSMQVEGKSVGGLSFRLARANSAAKLPTYGSRPPTRVTHGIRQASIQPTAPPDPSITLTLSATPELLMRAIAESLKQKRIGITQFDATRGLVSAGPIPLSADQMREAVPAEFIRGVREATGHYYVSFKIEKRGAEKSVWLTVSTRIILKNTALHSPLGGIVVPSNGTLEKRHAESVVQVLEKLR